MRSLFWITLGVVVVPLPFLAVPGTAQLKDAQTKDEFFRQRVAPVLQQRCVACHNPQKTRGGLDLTTRAQFLEGGDKGPVVKPGDADNSLLYQMVRGPEPKMPRQAAPLSAAEVAAFKQWIDDGAVWPETVKLVVKGPKEKGGEWWSLQPLLRPALPGVKDKQWPRTPVDYFILATLEDRGLSPAPEVDRATFIRRATYDLHGLPPTPEEIDAFVKDKGADAFERLIDRLLASPRYGERWGRFWLDLVHYADTHGYDKDKRRLWAWLFRDWVIRAFNQDLPYRRFVRYQLAGDVIAPTDPDGVIATGFIAAGPWDFVGHVELREGTVDKEKTRLLDRDDMVQSTLATFTSVTAGCARCHDHKFDPIPQREYYRLQAVFAGVERGDRPFATKQTQEQRAALLKEVKTATQQQAALEQKIAALTSPELKTCLAEAERLRTELAALPRPILPKPSPTNGYHSGISPVPDVEKWVQVDLGKPVPVEVVRLLPARPTDFRDSPGFGFPRRFRVQISDDAKFGMAETVADHADADFTNPGDLAYVVRLKGKTARYVRVTALRLWERTKDYVFALAELQVESGGQNIARGATVAAKDSIEAGRWSKKYLVDNFDSRNALAAPGDAWRQRDDLLVGLLARERQQRGLTAALIDPATQAALAKAAAALTGLQKRLQELDESQKVYAVLPRPPRPIHVLHRGDVERKGDLVTPGALSLVPGLKHDFALANPQDEGARRAALAEWVVDDRNVLTWRSVANRVWQSHFGRGLVDTPNDFGRNGSTPTHPALLDWLAVEFRDNGGSFKKLHRILMLSAAYRQVSRHHEGNARIDGDNRYLWRMNRARLDAESIRDSVLAVSGKMNYTMYGPGFELFRYKDDHSPIYDHTDVTKINHPDAMRRTVYRFVVRSVANPFLECLDCADPNISVPVRNATMTAPQALALLNNAFMVRQAEYFAERLRKHSDDPQQQITAAYRLAFGRPPTARERNALAGYSQRHGLANACRLLFNANEFLFVD
jgi:hypothetical protein